MSQQYIGTGRIDGTTQVITTTASSSAISNAVGSQTRKVRICGDTAFHATTGAAPTASVTTSPFFPANSPEYITINPGEKVAAIRASTSGLVTATDGKVTVTEVP